MTSLAAGEARYKSLTEAHKAALASGNTERADQIISDLGNLRGQVLNAAFQSKINQFIANAGVGVGPGELGHLIEERRLTTKKIKDVAAAFSKSAKAAADAEDNLFFNKLSKALKDVGETITALKSRAKEIKGTLASLDKPQDVDDVLEDVETVKGVLDGLKTDLESIKANFAG